MEFRKLAGVTAEELEMCRAVRLALKVSERKIRDVADELGVSEDKLGNIAAARTKVPHDLVPKLRMVLNLPVDWPYKNGSMRMVGDGKLLPVGISAMKGVRVVGKVSAGPGATNVDEDDPIVFIPDRLAALGTLAWTVEGDSMMPALEPGDIALFRESHTLRRRFAYLLKDSEGSHSIKMTRWTQAGKWEGYSLNPAYAPIDLDGMQVLGILVG